MLSSSSLAKPHGFVFLTQPGRTRWVGRASTLQASLPTPGEQRHLRSDRKQGISDQRVDFALGPQIDIHTTSTENQRGALMGIDDMAPKDKLELRGLYPRDLVEALDMISIAQGRTRVDLVGRVLAAYVVAKQREASLIGRTPQINPQSADSGWTALEG